MEWVTRHTGRSISGSPMFLDTMCLQKYYLWCVYTDLLAPGRRFRSHTGWSRLSLSQSVCAGVSAGLNPPSALRLSCAAAAIMSLESDWGVARAWLDEAALRGMVF